MNNEQKEQLAALAAAALQGQCGFVPPPTAILNLLEENKRLEQERNDAYRALVHLHQCGSAVTMPPSPKKDAYLRVAEEARAFVEGEGK